MKLYILDNGFIEGTCKIFYRREDGYSGNDKILFPVNAFLIETDEGKRILFDTGVYPGGIRAKSTSYRYQTRSQTVENQLRLCNVTPDDVDAVILSHLHYDHAGCLYLFEGKDIYVSEREYALAFGDSPPAAYASADYKVEGRWHLIRGDGELFPGIESVLLPGHTPGTLGLIVRLRAETVFLTQDAVYAEDNYYPKCMIPGLLADENCYKESLKKVKRLQARYHAILIFGHDAQQRNRLKMAPLYYE